jgi:hypothetical protein
VPRRRRCATVVRRSDRAHGPQAYAQESLKVTPEANAALLAADAAAAINEFLDALEP